jgi:hypothetical protein
MTQRHLEDFGEGRTFGSRRLRIDLKIEGD